MPIIVQVTRVDGCVQPVDIDSLVSEQLSPPVLIERQDDWQIFEFRMARIYHCPEMRFVVETTESRFRGPRPGDTYRHPFSGQTQIIHHAYQVVDEDWLRNHGYELAGTTREFATKCGRKNAAYPALFKSAIRRGLIDKKPLQFPKDTWWIQWVKENGHVVRDTEKAGSQGGSLVNP